MKEQRSFIKIISDIASTEGYTLETYGGGWLLELKNGEDRLLLHGYKFPVNDASASTLADDKATLSEFLMLHGIPQIPHYFIDCRGGWQKIEPLALSQFRQYPALVIKPNNGTGGQNVMFVNTMEELRLCVEKLSKIYDMLALSPYVEAEAEYRVIIYNGEVEISFEKIRRVVYGDGITTIGELSKGEYTDFPLDYIPRKGERVLLTKKHNLGLGAVPKTIESNDKDKIFALARKAIKVSGLSFASVDILRVKGELYVIEINSGVMTERYSMMSNDNYERARAMYSRVIKDCFMKNKGKNSHS